MADKRRLAKLADLETLDLTEDILRLEYSISAHFWMGFEDGQKKDEAQFEDIQQADCMEELTESCWNLHPSMAVSGKVGGSNSYDTLSDMTVSLADKHCLLQH